MQLTGADVPDSWSSDLERYALRFAFNDGIIDHVCPHPNDEIWSLNIKRAILSTFQHALDDEYQSEADVNGRCPTEYERTSDDGTTSSIRRTKNLLGCRDRQQHLGTVRHVPYDVHSVWSLILTRVQKYMMLIVMFLYS